MLIGGFLKQSFIDWEGKAGAVIFTKGCNFRCPYCHNPGLVLPQLFSSLPKISTNDVLEYLNSRKNWLDAVIISGGEPTIHNKNLKQFLRDIKKLNYLIKLDTNGSNPEILKELIDEKLIDYVALDIKSILQHKEYSEITNIKDVNIVDKVKESLNILKNSDIDFQLRTTLVNYHHNEEIIQKLKAEFSQFNYKLQEFKKAKTVSDY